MSQSESRISVFFHGTAAGLTRRVAVAPGCWVVLTYRVVLLCPTNNNGLGLLRRYAGLLSLTLSHSLLSLCPTETDIGTALEQIDEKGDVEERVDECSGIVVMNNDIDTQVSIDLPAPTHSSAQKLLNGGCLSRCCSCDVVLVALKFGGILPESAAGHLPDLYRSTDRTCVFFALLLFLLLLVTLSQHPMPT